MPWNRRSFLLAQPVQGPQGVLASNKRLIVQFWTLNAEFFGLGVDTLGGWALSGKVIHLGANSA
jgi:hypothetical protein